MWDKVLPHRLAINQALRTTSDDLKKQITEKQAEYAAMVARCNSEIEREKQKKDNDFEIVKMNYCQELENENFHIEEVQKLFLEYADGYLNQQLLYKCREQTKIELQAAKEHIAFLTKQMILIGEEITILERRKDTLSQKVNVKDIIGLIRLSDCGLVCEDQDDAKILLNKVNDAVAEYSESPVTKRSLLKLRSLLQERAEYLPIIQYISWLIQQKKNMSKELSEERKQVNQAQKSLKTHLVEINGELFEIQEKLNSFASQIREIWAIPIAEIYVGLAECKAELDYSYEQRSYVQDSLNYMKTVRSGDSDKWNRLQKEKNSLSETIMQLKADRSDLNMQLHQWIAQKKAVFSLFNRNGIYLKPPVNREQPDEIRVLQQKRVSLDSKIKEKNNEYGACIALETEQHCKKMLTLEKQLSVAEKDLEGKRKTRNRARQHLSDCQQKDNRFIIVKLFSESNEITDAKRLLISADASFHEAEHKLQRARQLIEEEKDSYDRKISELEKQKKCEIDAYEAQQRDIDRGLAYIINRRKGGKSYANTI